MVGGVLGFIPSTLLYFFFKYALGLRPLSQYPEIKELNAANWYTPDG